jgi:mannonate dehydratase
MKRRNFLIATGAAGLATGIGAWTLWPDEGWVNPCRASLPAELASHELVQAAWEGIDPARFWDCHVHLVGTGDSASGAWFNPRMESWAHPIEFTQRVFYLNAGCTRSAPGQADTSYVERMRSLVDGLRPGAKLMLLAFDFSYSEAGARDLILSAFHTPNEYAQRVASAHPGHFEWAASVHPYRGDCEQALAWAAERGARAIKWLPPAMGIDPASARCDAFYRAASRLGLPLITHAGQERAVEGAGQPTFGNPLRLRRALDHGVRVIVAHCASMGQDRDLDRGPNGPWIDCFELFSRMMDESRYSGLLYGDLSALPQINRVQPALRRIVERTEWHSRLLDGSDYPLPGIMPLYSVEKLVALDLLEAAAAPVLRAIRSHNPLLFDFVLKRNLRAGSKRLSSNVFHTRDFFLAGADARNDRSAPPEKPKDSGSESFEPDRRQRQG